MAAAAIAAQQQQAQQQKQLSTQKQQEIKNVEPNQTTSDIFQILKQTQQPLNKSSTQNNEKSETTALITATSKDIQQQQNKMLNFECPKSMRDAIFLGVTYAEAKIGQKMPYLLSLDDQLNANNENQADTLCITIPTTPYRSRLRQITSDTYLCLNRLKPSINIHTENISMYSNCWQPVLLIIKKT